MPEALRRMWATWQPPMVDPAEQGELEEHWLKMAGHLADEYLEAALGAEGTARLEQDESRRLLAQLGLPPHAADGEAGAAE